MQNNDVIDKLWSSYKLGGMPLVLVIVGFLISAPGSLIEGSEDTISGVDPTLIFVIGMLLVVFGAFSWVVEIWVKQRLQVAFITTVNELVSSAGNASRDGANFKVALEDGLQKLPEIFETIRTVSSSQSATALPSQSLSG